MRLMRHHALTSRWLSVVLAVPIDNAGLGNVVDAKDVFFELEIEPLQARLLEVNDWLGAEAVEFKPYVRSGKGARAAAA